MMAIIVLVWLALSFRIVKETERGCILIFRNPWWPVESGLKFVPFGICQLATVARTYIQVELPGEPERVWREKEIKTTEAGVAVAVPKELPAEERDKWVLPNRITFDDKDPGEGKDSIEPVPNIFKQTEVNDKDDPLRKRVTVEMVCFFQYVVVDLLLFLKTFGNIAQAEKILSDTTVAELTDILQIGTVGRALRNPNAISEFATIKVAESLLSLSGENTSGMMTVRTTDPAGNALNEDAIRANVQTCLRRLNEALCQKSGIKIMMVKLKPFVLSRDLNVSLQGIAETKAAAVSKEIAANAEKIKRTLEGQGTAAAKRALKDELEISGDSVQALETLAAFDKSNLVLATGESPLGSLLQAAIGVKKVLKEQDENNRQQGGNR